MGPGFEDEQFPQARCGSPAGPTRDAAADPLAGSGDARLSVDRAATRGAGSPRVLGPRDLLLTRRHRARPRRRRAARRRPITASSCSAPARASSAATTRPISFPMANICRCGRSSRRSACRRLAPGDLDFLAGPGPRTLDLPGFGRVGVQICYEIIFSGQVVDRANRPDFLFNPSNDAWFGAWGPPQHLAQARLRAIEEGPAGHPRDADRHLRVIDAARPRRRSSLPLGRGGRDRRPPAARRARRRLSPASATCCPSPSRCCSSRRRLQSGAKRASEPRT